MLVSLDHNSKFGPIHNSLYYSFHKYKYKYLVMQIKPLCCSNCDRWEILFNGVYIQQPLLKKINSRPAIKFIVRRRLYRFLVLVHFRWRFRRLYPWPTEKQRRLRLFAFNWKLDTIQSVYFEWYFHLIKHAGNPSNSKGTPGKSTLKYHVQLQYCTNKSNNSTSTCSNNK